MGTDFQASQMFQSGHSDRLTASRAYAQKKPSPLSDAFKQLLPVLSRMRHAFSDGVLELPLDRHYLNPLMSEVIAAVEAEPAMAEHIRFYDQQKRGWRGYDDVVRDVTRDPSRFAKEVFQSAASGVDRTHIVVIPPVLGVNGPDRKEVDCARVPLLDAPLDPLELMVRLRASEAWTNADRLRGQKQIVLCDKRQVEGVQDKTFDGRTIFANIYTSALCVAPHRSEPTRIVGYERTV